MCIAHECAVGNLDCMNTIPLRPHTVLYMDAIVIKHAFFYAPEHVQIVQGALVCLNIAREACIACIAFGFNPLHKIPGCIAYC